MKLHSKIYVAGSTGMVGSSIVRTLKKNKFTNILTSTRKDLNLLDSSAVLDFFKRNKPNFVFICAARVGGIKANMKYKYEFIYENIQIQNNIINSAFTTNIKNLIFFGSSCIYPKMSKQPIKEEYLLTAPLEITNEFYALAKISGIKLCQSLNAQFKTNYLSIMPCNLYGPNDNYDLNNSHVIPGLIAKIHIAKQKNQSQIVLWGSNKTKREFLHVDDLADACIMLMKKKYKKKDIINIGSGEEITISRLANMIKKVINYKGKVLFDSNEPIGTPRKILDSSNIFETGWRPKIDLINGLEKTYELRDFRSS